jgi:single-stranded DNA-binding protein
MPTLRGQISGPAVRVEMIYTNNGFPIVNFSMPSERRDAKNNKITDWVKCVCLGERFAKLVTEKWLYEKRQITVFGEVSCDIFKRNNGEPGGNLKILVRDIEFLAGGKRNEEATEDVELYNAETGGF